MLSPEELASWKRRLAAGEDGLARELAPVLIAELESVKVDALAYCRAVAAEELSHVVRLVSAEARAGVTCPTCRNDSLDLVMSRLRAAASGHTAPMTVPPPAPGPRPWGP